MPHKYDVIIIGAGAAGLMCAIEAAQRGRKTLVLDHAKKIAEKIRISGGGRCNFTNLHIRPEAYLSRNPHFCKSALKQYTQHDFIEMVKAAGIAYHEKKLGQLFCDDKSQQIIDMLVSHANQSGAKIWMESSVDEVLKADDGLYNVNINGREYSCESLVIATGGLSIPKIGASKFGYDIARQFDHSVIETRAGLAPLTFTSDLLDFCKSLSGLSVEAVVSCGKTSFAEGLLFTHRGLSGPSVLQISSYWKEGESLSINLAPDSNILEALNDAKIAQPKAEIQTVLSQHLPKRLALALCERVGVKGRIGELSNKSISILASTVSNWQVKPNGSEGYRTAEVTLGGVNTDEISSKTMQSKRHEGLYFIGEVVDVTGHLGGYNFQWAWSSGYVAGQHA